MSVEKILPRHIGILGDGNRRYARREEKASWEGYYFGGRVLETVAQEIFNRGIHHVSFWAISEKYVMSTSHSVLEQRQLNRIVAQGLDRASKDNWPKELGVRIRVVGDWPRAYSVSGYIEEMEMLSAVEARTRPYSKGNFLNVCTVYSGYTEERQAWEKYALLKLKHPEMEANERILKALSQLPGTPDVDLFIRTGFREDEESKEIYEGFLTMHRSSNSVAFFTPVLWPDFKEKDLLEALEVFNQWALKMRTANNST